MAFSLSACGFTWPQWANQDKDPLAFLGDDGKQTNVPPPPDLIPKDEPDQRDPRSRLIPTTTMGVDLDTYFIQDIKDPVTRMQRLENVVLAMHKDMQNIINVTPLHVQNLQMEKNRSSGGEIVTGAPQPLMRRWTDVPQPGESEETLPLPESGQAASPEFQNSYQDPFSSSTAQPPAYVADQAAIAPTAGLGGAAITGIRAGTHPDKIRIVFDTTAGTPFKADLDNSEHILIIEIPEAQWQAPTSSQFFGNMPLLESFKMEPFNGTGSRVVFQLKKSTAIISQRMYPALSGTGQRIVIDLDK